MISSFTKREEIRNKLLVLTICYSAIQFISEIVVFNIFRGTIVEAMSETTFLLWMVMFPTALQLFASAVSFALIKLERISAHHKDYIVNHNLLFTMIVTQLFYYSFGPILCIPCIAVILSIIFISRRLTAIMSAITFLSCTITIPICYYMLPGRFYSHSVNATISLFIIGVFYLVSDIIIKYIKEQTDSINIGEKVEKDLIKRLRLDPMTGLYNRNGMEDIMDDLIKSYTNERPMSLLMLDLDDFKKINDTYGHLSGDMVLTRVADLIHAMGRKNIIPCRYGGEEIVIVFKNTSESEAEKKATALLNRFRGQSFEFAPHKTITFSGGIAEYQSNMTKDDWIRLADTNMYIAKDTGKNKIVV